MTSLNMTIFFEIGCPQNCKDGCINGPCKECIREHYGPMCNKKCIQVCTDNTCDIEKGECLKGLILTQQFYDRCIPEFDTYILYRFL